MTARILAFLWITLALAAAARAEEPAGPELQRAALEQYQRAQALFGLALGERCQPDEGVQRLLLRPVADLLCLKLEEDGCLAASAQAQRALGPYAEPWTAGRLPGEAELSAAFEFLTELQVLSAGFGQDRSLATEGLAYQAQLAGDRLRRQAIASLRPKYKAALHSARKAPAAASLTHWVLAGRTGWWMLDAEAVAEAGRGLAEQILAGAPPGASADAVAEVLDRGRRALRVLGRTEDLAGVEAALARLETKAAPPAELHFELAPPAEHFHCDLVRARAQLMALAGRAPLYSRPSAVLHALAALAGVVGGEPVVAAEIEALRDSLLQTDPELAARTLGLMGRDALGAGDPYRAAGHFEQAEHELAGHCGAERLRALLVANRAQALFLLGEYQESAAVFATAVLLLADQPAAEVQALLGQAHGLLFGDRLEPVAALLDRAEALLPEVDGGQRAALSRAVRIDRAQLAWRQGRPEQVESLLAGVGADALAAGDVRSGAIARTNLAEWWNDHGQPQRALTEAESALRWLDPAAQADAAWQALTEKGRALAALGRGAEARRVFEQAMQLVEQLRSLVGAEGARRSFSAAKARLYSEAAALLHSGGQDVEAFAVTERARSRAFLDMLAERQLGRGEAARARLEAIRQLPPLALGFAEPAAALASPTVSRRGAKLPRPDPRQGWIGLVTVNPAGVDDVRRVLQEDEALLAFFHDGRRLLGFLVGRDGLTVGVAEVEAEQLTRDVRAWLRLLRSSDSSEDQLRRKAERVYRHTLAPLAGRLGARRLVVVPWGPLHAVPFAALWDGQRYLLDTHDLASVPSASTLVMLRSRQAAAAAAGVAPLLVLANPKTDLPDLPAAESEALALGQLVAGAEVHCGPAASERLFDERAPRARWIHLASHGVFLPARPMDSYLALAAGDELDGRLAASEVLGLDLSAARLVVLSACHSAEAEVLQGEELIGLSRAFLHAGTQALVAALWPLADESAAELMRGFYAGLQRGKAPAAALADALRALKAKPQFAHPFFWAPVELIGL